MEKQQTLTFTKNLIKILSDNLPNEISKPMESELKDVYNQFNMEKSKDFRDLPNALIDEANAIVKDLNYRADKIPMTQKTLELLHHHILNKLNEFKFVVKPEINKALNIITENYPEIWQGIRFDLDINPMTLDIIDLNPTLNFKYIDNILAQVLPYLSQLDSLDDFKYFNLPKKLTEIPELIKMNDLENKKAFDWAIKLKVRIKLAYFDGTDEFNQTLNRQIRIYSDNGIYLDKSEVYLVSDELELLYMNDVKGFAKSFETYIDKHKDTLVFSESHIETLRQNQTREALDNKVANMIMALSRKLYDKGLVGINPKYQQLIEEAKEISKKYEYTTANVVLPQVDFTPLLKDSVRIDDLKSQFGVLELIFDDLENKGFEISSEIRASQNMNKFLEHLNNAFYTDRNFAFYKIRLYDLDKTIFGYYISEEINKMLRISQTNGNERINEMLLYFKQMGLISGTKSDIDLKDYIKSKVIQIGRKIADDYRKLNYIYDVVDYDEVQDLLDDDDIIPYVVTTTSLTGSFKINKNSRTKIEHYIKGLFQKEIEDSKEEVKVVPQKLTLKAKLVSNESANLLINKDCLNRLTRFNSILNGDKFKVSKINVSMSEAFRKENYSTKYIVLSYHNISFYINPQVIFILDTKTKAFTNVVNLNISDLPVQVWNTVYPQIVRKFKSYPDFNEQTLKELNLFNLAIQTAWDRKRSIKPFMK